MKKRRILKIAIWTASVFVVLVAVLVVHIVMVTGHKRNDQRMRQLSRIDFKEQIDSAEAVKITGFVASLEGVNDIQFNNNILVYTYTVGTQTSEGVYEKLIKHGHYNASRYVVDQSKAATGCPVIEEGSLSHRFSSLVTGIFN